MSLVTQLLAKVVDHNLLLYGLAKIFNVDSEKNIPSFYSSISLLLCSFLLAIIAINQKHHKDNYFIHWSGLSLVFALLSWDEAVSLHEELTNVPIFSEIPRVLGLGHPSIFKYTWVVAGIIFIVLFSLTYLKFFLSLSFRTKRLILSSMALFVGGALGMEMISGLILDSFGNESIVYILENHVEELGEMLGIATFIYTLLRQLSLYAKEIDIVFENTEANLNKKYS